MTFKRGYQKHCSLGVATVRLGCLHEVLTCIGSASLSGAMATGFMTAFSSDLWLRIPSISLFPFDRFQSRPFKDKACPAARGVLEEGMARGHAAPGFGYVCGNNERQCRAVGKGGLGRWFDPQAARGQAKCHVVLV